MPAKSKISIKLRLIFFILLSQTLLYTAFVTLITISNQSTVREAEQATFKLLENTIKWSIEDELTSARLAVSAVSSDTQVQKLFAERNRDALAEYLQPLYRQIQNEVSRFHFHLPDGVSFLRLHNPSVYGDNLLQLRPLVADALRLKTRLSGIEQGIDGLGLRVVDPLYHTDSFIGALEYGMEFGAGFIARLREKYEADYFMFTFTPDQVPVLVAGTKTIDACRIAVDFNSELLANQAVWSLSCTDAYAVGMYPFTSYNGKVLGYIKAEIHSIPLADALRRIQKTLVFLGIILLGVLCITIVFAMRILLRPLDSVIMQTRSIAERIIAGDIEYKGDVHNVIPDFRNVIETVNEIIATLRGRQILLQAIVEGIPGIVYYVDNSRKVVWANQRACQLVPAIVGSDVHNVKAGFMNDENSLIEKVFITGQIIKKQTCYTNSSENHACKDCTKIECWEHTAVPVCHPQGGVNGVVRIVSNITDKHKVEAALKKMNESLEQRIEEEIEKRKAGERIADQQSRLAAIGELATGMAHEITQPLNAISFAIDNLKARFEADRLNQDYMNGKVKDVAADIERVRRVIDHVRLFARSAPQEYQMDFMVNSCIENALALIGAQLSSRGISLQLELQTDLPSVNGNPYQYEQVMLNLLSNARDAIEELSGRDGIIVLRSYHSAGSITVEIEDNGSGIPENLGDKVFDPFFTTKEPGKGTGLGLSISFGIVSEMKGSIELQRLSGGTKAVVTIPAGNEDGVS